LAVFNFTMLPVRPDILPETVDLLILGGTAMAASLACSAAQAGAHVFLASSRPYLGEDLCGNGRFWPDEAELRQSWMGEKILAGNPIPLRPMAIKLGLEQALVEAGIPFLLNAAPARLLYNAEGDIAGCQLATRSGLIPVAARLVVDASADGAPSRMAGAGVAPLPKGKQLVHHLTLCRGEGQDAEGVTVIDRPPALEGDIQGEAYSLSARLYELEVDFGEGGLRDFARAEAEIVDRCWVPEEFTHQERVTLARSAVPARGTPATDSIPFHRGMAVLSPALADPYTQPDWPGLLHGETIGKSLSTMCRERALPNCDSLDVLGEVPVLEEADVLILGGGTAGAPSAISAARAGADTVVVEGTDQLGGVSTAGQIARYWCGNRVGFTDEIDRGVAALETDERLRKNVGQWSITAKSRWYEHECHSLGVTLLYRSLCADARVEKGRVTGLYVATPFGFGLITAKCVIDATGCADVAAYADAPVRTIGAEHVAVQGTGLAGIHPLVDYHNSDHNFCDDTDAVDASAFLVSSKLKFRDHFDAGQLVDSRERRQIVGDITLGPADFLAERRYPDTICVASSNFDSHGFTIHPLFMCLAPHKKRLWADVPFRALLPQGLERLFVTGLGVSSHRDALPVIRMQADVQNQGYAVGYAAAMSARTHTDLRDLPIREIQAHLHEKKILPERAMEDVDTFPVADEVLRHAVAGETGSLRGLALVFSEPERSLPLVLEALHNEADTEQRHHFALIAALLGDCSVEPLLMEALSTRQWDTGWNFTGMGQFGMSLSKTDARLIALGRIGSEASWPLLLEMGSKLSPDSEFSHFRALAEACEALYPRCHDNRANEMLSGLLRLTGVMGHARTCLRTLQEDLTEDPNETRPRNRVLRELHLARALFRCGDDAEGLGRSLLEAYSCDLRGAFARHASAVLNESPVPGPVPVTV